MQGDGAADGAAMVLPPGCYVESGGPGRLVLGRDNRSAVAAFSAFGPMPEAIREAAEEDRRRWRTPAPAGDEDERRDG